MTANGRTPFFHTRNSMFVKTCLHYILAASLLLLLLYAVNQMLLVIVAEDKSNINWTLPPENNKTFGQKASCPSLPDHQFKCHILTLITYALSSYLLLDGQFHLNPFRVWFCPEKASINETYL